MKETFRQYHQFTPKGYKDLVGKALFVFDTNTLLNMYRYSRDTVDEFIDLLLVLKTKKQVWIPYQVGFEFYENRLEVIGQTEKSYDDMVTILEKTKATIKTNYKNHPIIDMVQLNTSIDTGLKESIELINDAKNKHPKWAKSDDVLVRINEVFKDAVGREYNEDELKTIIADGETRYEKRIPPGFRDAQKISNSYGDLILWMQIIEKAKEVKKPIVLISGDVKDDWWLQKDGERIMPLPALKKEMLIKANVDFHIYTADRFLEIMSDNSKKINESAITEVRKLREDDDLDRVHPNSRLSQVKSFGFMLEEEEIMRETLDVFYSMADEIKDLAKVNKDELNRLYFRGEMMLRRCKQTKTYSRFIHSNIQRYLRECAYTLFAISENSDTTSENKTTLIKYLQLFNNIESKLNTSDSISE